MSKRRKGGVDRRDPLTKKLDKAMTETPGLMREVVKEALHREDQANAPQPPSSDTSAAKEPPKREFKLKQMSARIIVDNPAQAEELRAGLAQHEVDSVVFADGKWIYIRARAIAEEVVKGEKPGQGGTGDGAKGSGGSGEGPDSDKGGKSDILGPDGGGGDGEDGGGDGSAKA